MSSEESDPFKSVKKGVRFSDNVKDPSNDYSTQDQTQSESRNLQRQFSIASIEEIRAKMQDLIYTPEKEAHAKSQSNIQEMANKSLKRKKDRYREENGQSDFLPNLHVPQIKEKRQDGLGHDKKKVNIKEMVGRLSPSPRPTSPQT